MTEKVNIYEGIKKARFKTETVNWVSTKVFSSMLKILAFALESKDAVTSYPIEACLEAAHPKDFVVS